ncbi:putative carboxypeptidase YodJ [Pullulanibacillus camelliae]|uniref:Putative carboxypeptidase YodJ n=1 Tax=Pullulanibacillus camelliae TaxID=1707096 RepID=A0A8J2YMC1_9BACL|nr:M15 family metallopeptidase [Pullulanibacillus camelliae]GGE52425.1 putative carboxypeptidase YodJ [Pullulanibacillus camelliae]
MKIIKIVALCLGVLLLIAGCSSDKSSQSEQKQSEKKTEQNKTESPADKGSSEKKADKKSQENKQPTPVKRDKDGLIIDQNPESLLVLVNKTHKLPDGYVPPNLVYPDVRFPYSDMIEKRQVRSVTAKALKQLFKAADQAGYKLYGESGYRSYDRQVNIYNGNVDKYGAAKASTISAHPGTSEHQTGLAIDITSQEMLDNNSADPLVEKFGDTAAGKWVAANAHKYGFIIRYPKGKEQITGYEYEPWHIRYVGVKVATDIYNHGWTLEEYLQHQ